MGPRPVCSIAAMGVDIRSGRQPDAVCGSRRAVSRRGTVEGRRAGPGGDSGLRVRGRAAAGDRSCNLSSGYGFEQTVSSAWLNAGGYNSGPCIPPGSMSCMWYAIEGHDGNDVLARRRQARPEHLARLAALRDAGRLLLAGPCPAIDEIG